MGRLRRAGLPRDYEDVTKQIIAEIERGPAPWTFPWEGGEPPRNLRTMRYYSGLNELCLWCAQWHRFKSAFWLTANQAREMGGRVRDSELERGTTINVGGKYHHKVARRKMGRGRWAQKSGFLRQYTVFSTDQCELLPPRPTLPEVPGECSFPRLERLIAASGMTVRIGGTVARYDAETDTVIIPPCHLFYTPVNWNFTALHEMGHASAHPSRLNRRKEKGLVAFSREEIRVELAAVFAARRLGLRPTVHSADYIAVWLRSFKADDENALIWEIAIEAAVIADYLISFDDHAFQ